MEQSLFSQIGALMERLERLLILAGDPLQDLTEDFREVTGAVKVLEQLIVARQESLLTSKLSFYAIKPF